MQRTIEDEVASSSMGWYCVLKPSYPRFIDTQWFEGYNIDSREEDARRNGMILYHGNTMIVECPALMTQNRALDFGSGFYTTENKAQAVFSARKVYRRRNKEGVPTVNIYEFDENAAFAECSLLQFDAADEAWLDFVSDHRNRSYNGDAYELIYGPVAYDDIFLTFTLYAGGELTKEETINRLKVKKLFNQLVLASEKALSYLKFVGTLEEKELIPWSG